MADLHCNYEEYRTDCIGRNYREDRGKRGFTGKYNKEYKIWHGMVARCRDPHRTEYPRYGMVGVTVCDEWVGEHGFLKFLEHVGPAPTPKHTIDRIKGDRGYEPGNVRWATMKEQQRNKKSNRMLTHNGRTQCVSAWAEEMGFNRESLLARLKKWSVEKALTTPVSERHRRGKS